MDDIKAFTNWLQGNRFEFTQKEQEFMGTLGHVIDYYLREKASTKGFHGDCTSTKHSIGTSYCMDCQP